MTIDDAINSINQAAFHRFARALDSKRMIAMIGAGVSAAEGYPSWDELLEKLHQFVFADADASRRAEEELLRNCRDKAWRAEEYRMRMRDYEYEALMSRVFDRFPPEPSPFLKNLVALPFRHILTTNYDRLLEKTHVSLWNDAERPLRIVDWAKDGELREFIAALGGEVGDGKDRRYVHIHGRINNVRSMVLTDRDYLSRYVRSDDMHRKLFAVFSTHRVVFIGFSLSDPDFVSVLREIHTSLAGDEPPHFALLPFDRDVKGEDHPEMARSRLRKKYGIEPVFYPVIKKRHTALMQLVQLLAGKRRGSIPTLRLQANGSAMLKRMNQPREREQFYDPDDPQRGQWGGKPKSSGRALSARVVRASDGWYRAIVVLKSTNRKRIAGPVHFHLHDTFDPSVLPGELGRDGLTASVEFWTYGAFTVGVEADDGKTRLELDLGHVPGATDSFRAR